MRYRNEAHTTPESATRGMGNTHIVERTENTDLLSNVCVCVCVTERTNVHLEYGTIEAPGMNNVS